MARVTASNRFKVRNVPYSIKAAGPATGGISVANHASINPTSAVTVEIWFFPTQFNLGTNILFDNSTSGATYSYYVDFTNQGKIRWFSVINGSSVTITGTTTRVVLNKWNFLSATYTGSAVYLYFNGVKLDEEVTGLSGVLGTNSEVCRIAYAYNASSFYSLIGNIYRPRVYNVGCTLAEHQDRYYLDKTSTALQAGLVLDLTMTEGSGSSIADSSGLSNTGTLISPSTWDSTQVPFKSRSTAANRVTASGRVAA